jgi:predicted transcriptional regulator
MRGRPKTLRVTASMSELRDLFANPNVVTALIVDDSAALVGVVERSKVLETDLPDEAPIDSLIQREVDAINVGEPASEFWKHPDLARTGRLVVLETDGKTLAGLVCARPNGGGFCL